MRLSVCVALTLVLTSSLAMASDDADPPATDAAIRGVVLAAMRMPIPGAQITVISLGAAPISATTDQSGVFALRVATGQYTVRIHVDGFRDAEQRVSASSPTAAVTEFVLQVAGLHEAVSVTAHRD